MKFEKYIANSITCLNLICGCLAVVAFLNRDIYLASYFIFIAMIFDFFDGFVARVLNAKSEFGKQLDTLADAVSFGLVPGVMMYKLIYIGLVLNNSDFANHKYLEYLPYLGFLITVFSVLRLAKFNIDKRQTDSFIGLPTPASAFFIISLPLILRTPKGLFFYSDYITVILLKPMVLISITFFLSALMVSEIPLFSLKFKSFSLKENTFQYLLLFISVILIVFFYFNAFPIIIILYIILSIINNFIKNKNTNEIQS